MKKILSIALVALLAASMAFAGFSGSATAGFGYNFETKQYGFIGNDTSVTFDFDIATADAEKIAEGDVYASIKANFKLGFMSNQNGTAPGDPFEASPIKDTKAFNANIYTIVDITEAKVAGENWYVSLLGVPSQPDFAKSAIDTNTVKKDVNDYGVYKAKYSAAYTYKPGYEKAPGVEVGIAGYKLGFGLLGLNEETKKTFATAYVATPEYKFAEDQLAIKAGAVYTYSETKVGEDKTYGANNNNTLGASLALTGDFDWGKFSVASDLGYNFKKDDAKDAFGMDVAAKLSVDPITLDVYYATSATAKKDGLAEGGVAAANDTKKDLLSAKLVADLNSFEVPVKLTFQAKDILKSQDMKLTAAFALDALELSVYGGYKLNNDLIADTNKNDKISAGASASYAFDAFKIEGGLDWSTVVDEKDMVLAINAAISSDAIIPGATLKLAYSEGDNDMNLLKDQKTAQDFGKIVASCNVAF